MIRLVTLAPGHFHAALVQKRMTPGVARRSYVYGPLDADTVAHLDRLAAFNARPGDPTVWEVDARVGPEWGARFLGELPGNTVVVSGRNRPKIDLMRLAVAHGLHVLADKPWIVEAADFPKLEALLREAETRDLLVWDILTERWEVTNRLRRELVRDPDVFGRWQPGTPDQPALVLESVHYLKKLVAGRPLVRPWWWFDPSISGEAMADVGTHLADLALWLVAPDQPVDYRTDVRVLAASRWPVGLSEGQFLTLTGLPEFPRELAGRVANGTLAYAGNNAATFTLRGVHVKLVTRWGYEALDGGDTHHAVSLGTKARVEVRQPPGERPRVFVSALDPARHEELFSRLEAKCEKLGRDFPGLAVANLGSEVRVLIPDELRTGHEDHFGLVLDEFAHYFHNPDAVPPWEAANALARYHITTRAVEMGRE